MTLFAFSFLILVYWFVPSVWKLKTSSITVTRWIKVKGEVEQAVGPAEKIWTPYSRISRHTLSAIISAEDGRFYKHHGLDFEEIVKSFQLNLKHGRYLRGGSTITQQVVKVAFLSRDKNLIRKSREATGALLVENILDKKQIIEWYLNLVEFGDGVYGIKQAAQHYFGTKPELLTIAQSIHLALVLPSPNRWSEGLKKRQLTEFGHRRFTKIVTTMYISGLMTQAQWLTTLATGNFGSPIDNYERIRDRFVLKNAPTKPNQSKLMNSSKPAPNQSLESINPPRVDLRELEMLVENFDHPDLKKSAGANDQTSNSRSSQDALSNSPQRPTAPNPQHDPELLPKSISKRLPQNPRGVPTK
jgi:monofunctional glycosyltransferase